MPNAQTTTAVPPARQDQDLPLCVDLDGTLLKSDLLVETALALLAARPWMLFAMFAWLLGGKACFKREVASRATVDGELLPWDVRVVERLHAERGRRRLVLCTAADHEAAVRATAHLALFDEVLASDGRVNLSGPRKAAALVARFGERGFDYAANARVDLPVWRQARRAWVVNAPAGLADRARRQGEVAVELAREGGGWRAWVRALRLHQWLKNLLVFLPLLASHRFLQPDAIVLALCAFFTFGLCASGVYLLNDLLDLPSDRRHPRKRLRPFAAGSLPLLPGLVAAPALSLFALALAAWVQPRLAGVLGLYYLCTLAYSMALKKRVMIDVVMLAGLYTLRIIGGAVAIGAALSFWLLAFSMFLFLSLAMLKRYTELATLLADGRDTASGRGYRVEDLPLLQSLGSSAGYLAVLVLALYINSPESLQLYSHPKLLWLLCPLLLYWMSWVWVVAHRGRMHDDPVVFAVTDPVSRVIVLACAVVAYGAI
jgi:4-hydroxybenzoate polyprenyltransferase